jgi:hypothetical protein
MELSILPMGKLVRIRNRARIAVNKLFAPNYGLLHILLLRLRQQTLLFSDKMLYKTKNLHY